MNVFEIAVHPKADVFPMLSEQELLELANDISENGLLEPLIIQEIDGEPILIDGRNRRAACEMVHVEPEVEWLNGQDATAYIYSKNITRRNLSAGQKAMAHAMLYPQGEKGGRGKKGNTQYEGFGSAYLTRARFVLHHAPMAAEQVIKGVSSLNAAYEETKEDKARKSTSEYKLKELSQKYPDLAKMVEEDQLSFGEAIAASQKRDEEERQRISGLNDSLKVLESALRRVSKDILVKRLASFVTTEKEFVSQDINPHEMIDSFISQLTKLKGEIHDKKN